MTILEAIKNVLLKEQVPMNSEEIYEMIIEDNLYSFEAKRPKDVVNGLLRRHRVGIEFPSASPVKHFKVVKQDGNKNYYWLNDNDDVEINIKEPEGDEKELLPEEKMLNAYNEHYNNMKQDLLDEILRSDPAFFEQLVSDLLVKMGYGYDATASKVVGGSNDQGIDCVIEEDKLGLDKIFVQAKRYSPDNTVGRPALQSFIGAMENVQKGVFITTSSFTKQAKDFADRQQQKNLKLIDGDMLADLMIRYKVGVSPIKSFSTYKIDMDYFS